MYDTNFCKPVMDDNTVTGIIVENKSGRYAYGCKMVVDTSTTIICTALFLTG